MKFSGLLKLRGLGVFMGLFFIYLAGITSLPLMDRDEPYYAETSREMNERGDFVIPYFNDRAHYDKPPLLFWCQALSYRIFGDTDFGARLPSVLAGALAALLVFGFGASLYGKSAGFWGAAVFGLCLQTLVLAKAAVTDMVTVFFVTLSFWAGWELCSAASEQKKFTPRTFFWWAAFYSATALGVLSKGPIGLIPAMSVILFLFWPGHRGCGRFFRLELGLVFILMLAGAWAFPAFIRTGGEYFVVGIGKHVIGRSMSAFEGHGGRTLAAYLILLPFYFVTIFASFFPWSLSIASMLRYFKTGGNIGKKEIYLLSGIVVTFVIFTLAKTKLPHYTYVCYPLLSILFIRFWFESGRGPHKLARLCAGMIVFTLSLSLFFFPVVSRYAPVPQLLRQSAAWLKPEMEFATVDYHEPGIVWYFRKYVKGWHESLNAQRIVEYMQRPGARFCLVPTSQVQNLFPQMDAAWKTTSARGINIAKGRRVDLTMVIKME